MQLQFTNNHIFFALDTIWDTLSYKFKYLINQLVAANPDDNYIQTIEISENILIQIFSTVTVLPEGMAAFLNQEMLTELIGQIQPQSNLDAVIAGTEEPNEAARIMIAINDIDVANKSMKAAKIASGKSKILA